MIAVIKAGHAQVSIWLASLQNVIDNYQDGVAQRHQRPLLAPAGGYPPVLGHQIGVFGLGGYVGDFDQDLPEPGIGLAGLATQPLASALLVARTHARPGSQMLGAGKALPVAGLRAPEGLLFGAPFNSLSGDPNSLG